VAFPRPVLALAVALSLLGGFGPNGLLALASVLVLLIGTKLLSRPGEAPILLFIFAYQWLQASIAIFYASWLGTTISEVTRYTRIVGGNADLATILSLSGILALAVCMRLGAGAYRPEYARDAQDVARRYASVRFWFYVYGVAWLVATMAQSASLVFPGLSQPLLALGRLKWAFFFILGYVTFVNRIAGRKYLIIAFVVEFLMSLGSFFSEFKMVFFFTLLPLVAAGVRPSIRQWMTMCMLGSGLLACVLVWTSIKGEYRAAARGPEAAQVVTLDYLERLRTLWGLLSELDSTKLAVGSDQLVTRISNIDFFAIVLEVVPDKLPYEGGAIWIDALTRSIMPRVIFAEKAIIDDSSRTRKYTGLAVAGGEQGTSISLGYLAESYIDFGPAGMLLPISLLGLLIGYIHRSMLASRGMELLLSMGLGTVVCFNVSTLETSITKSFGGLVVTLLVSWLITHFAYPLIIFPNARFAQALSLPNLKRHR
jgi:hypothetical protein